MQIGILGGTFNPVHFGHLLIAEGIREEFKLDKILFIPANIPPHKEFKANIETKDRLLLLKEAIKDNPYFELSEIEIERGGVSYTIDTVKYLYETMQISGKIHVIIGSDLIPAIDKWKDYRKLLELAQMVVYKRGSIEPADYKEKYDISVSKDAILFDVSSTLIRNNIKSGKSIKYLVPENVLGIIKANGYYL